MIVIEVFCGVRAVLNDTSFECQKAPLINYKVIRVDRYVPVSLHE